LEGDLFAYRGEGPVLAPPVARVLAVREEAKPTVSAAAAGGAPGSVFEAVWPVIDAALAKPAGAAELAKRLDVGKAQMEAWLKRALSEKKVRKLSKPVRYARVAA
jgi:hypothetical protein